MAGDGSIEISVESGGYSITLRYNVTEFIPHKALFMPPGPNRETGAGIPGVADKRLSPIENFVTSRYTDGMHVTLAAADRKQAPRIQDVPSSNSQTQ